MLNALCNLDHKYMDIMGTHTFSLVIDGAWAELQWVFYLRFIIFLAFVASVSALGLSFGGRDVASLGELVQFEHCVAGHRGCSWKDQCKDSAAMLSLWALAGDST